VLPAAGAAESRPVHDDSVDLVVESASVHSGADGDQGTQGSVARAEPQVDPAVTDAGENTDVMASLLPTACLRPLGKINITQRRLR